MGTVVYGLAIMYRTWTTCSRCILTWIVLSENDQHINKSKIPTAMPYMYDEYI